MEEYQVNQKTEIFNIVLFSFAISCILLTVQYQKTHSVPEKAHVLQETEIPYVEEIKVVPLEVPITGIDPVFTSTGEYLPMKTWILARMVVPESYTHKETRVIKNLDNWVVTSTINGQNYEGAYLDQTVTVKFGLNGEVIEYIP